jgi:hypothetical protein
VYYCAQNEVLPEEDAMAVMVACVLFITGIVAYFPIVYIRKTNRVLKALQQIEANTRKS